MATDDHSSSKVELYESGLTVPSDSENYSANNEMSSSVQSSSSSPLILYKPPTFWSVVRGAAINLVLPFVNGLMLGFGELFAHEAAFRLGWSNTKIMRPWTVPVPVPGPLRPPGRKPKNVGGKVSGICLSLLLLFELQNTGLGLVEHTMLGGSGLNGRGAIPAIARQRLTAFPRSSRSISSFAIRPSGGYGRFNKTPLAGGLAWKATSSFPGPMSARFNSTSSAASDASAASENLNDQAGNISNLSLDDINSIPEHIGYLKDLGLDFGWGPTSLIEYVIEHLHMWTGMPWWASIVATGLLIRAALVYPMLGASDTATKIQNLKHLSTPIRMRMLQHQAAGNSMELAKAKAEMSKLHQANGIDTKKAFIPFIQIPLGFGCYRLIKGMASLPVPGLAAESVAWLQDLTVADPYYILPTLSAGMMYLTFKKGGEAGMNEFQNSSFGKAMLFGLPAFSFAFMAWFPSALQLYFASTGLFALCQSHVLRNEQIRKSLGLAIPNKEQPPSNPLTAEGASKGLRLLQEAIEAEKAKMAEQQKQNPSAPVPDISFIDRMLNNIKESKDSIQREATEKMNEMRGETPGQNADGTPAEPPRLNEKDRKLAADYERRRKEEEDWKRDERNHARREAHMRALEAQREKARTSWEKNASQFKQR